MSKVVSEGWLVRLGRRKIGRSFIHMRYFVLEARVLAYYKKKPTDNMLPLKTLVIDGNCRVEDRGLKTHHGRMIYVLCVYNKKEKHHQITMGAYHIQEALNWKEKIEHVIDQKVIAMMVVPTGTPRVSGILAHGTRGAARRLSCRRSRRHRSSPTSLSLHFVDLAVTGFC